MALTESRWPRADRGAQRPQQGQVLVVAVVHRLDVQVNPVEALVHEPARLGHHALSLRQVAELHRPRPLPLVALAQPADPRQDAQVGGDAAGRGQEGAHLLAVVPGEAALRVERDDVRVDVGDAARAEPGEERLHLRLRVPPLQPPVLQPHRVAVVVEGVGRGVAHGRVGEVDEPGGTDEQSQQGEPGDESDASHRPPRRRRTRAAAWLRSWVRLTRAREAPSARSLSPAAPDRRSPGGP